jgi:hypothetical protein
MTLTFLSRDKGLLLLSYQERGIEMRIGFPDFY